MPSPTIGDFGRQLLHNRWVLPVAAVAAGAILFVSETSSWRALDSLENATAISQSRASLRVVLQLLTDAESGQRGFLLTGSEEYLQPYERALPQLEERLASLNPYGQDDPQMRLLLKQLRKGVDDKRLELSETVRRVHAGDRAGALALVRTNTGLRDMDAIRGLVGDILDFETVKYRDTARSVREALLLNRIGVGSFTALSLLAFAMYLRRTAELTRHLETQEGVVRAERDRLDAEVTRRTQQLAELARSLMLAREDERGRLARELHDELGALLTAAKLDVARIRARIERASPDAAQRLVHLIETLNSGIALKRRIIEDLRPSSLTNLGLPTALENLLREFAGRTGLRIDRSLEPVDVPPDCELTIYRLVQEALTNIAKYAKAQRVQVFVLEESGAAVVRVEDDGIGFDPASMPAGGHGLMGMRHRVEGEGGELVLDSSPGRGTRLEARLPANPGCRRSPTERQATV